MKYLLALTILLLASPAAFAGPAERELEAKLERQLEALLGPGKAKVSVSGETESPAQRRSVTRTKPQIVGQRQTTVRSSDGSSQTTTETSWTYDQTEELQSTQPSKLKNKSVSIIYEPPVRSEDETEDSSTPELDTAAIERIARAGAGLEENDRIHVQAGRMDTSAYDRLKAEMEKARQGTPVWVFVSIAAAGVGLGTGLGAVLMRRRKTAETAPPDWSQAQVWTSPAPAAPQPTQAALPQGNPVAAGPHGPVIHIQPPKS